MTDHDSAFCPTTAATCSSARKRSTLSILQENRPAKMDKSKMSVELMEKRKVWGAKKRSEGRKEEEVMSEVVEIVEDGKGE